MPRPQHSPVQGRQTGQCPSQSLVLRQPGHRDLRRIDRALSSPLVSAGHLIRRARLVSSAPRGRTAVRVEVRRNGSGRRRTVRPPDSCTRPRHPDRAGRRTPRGPGARRRGAPVHLGWAWARVNRQETGHVLRCHRRARARKTHSLAVPAAAQLPSATRVHAQVHKATHGVHGRVPVTPSTAHKRIAAVSEQRSTVMTAALSFIRARASR